MNRFVSVPKKLTTLEKVIMMKNKKQLHGKGICRYNSSSIATNSNNTNNSFRWFAHEDDVMAGTEPFSSSFVVVLDDEDKDSNKVWSGTMSFASSESDFVASDRFVDISNNNHNNKVSSNDWSGTISYASAESDFVASDRFVEKKKKKEQQSYNNTNNDEEWSKQMTFAAPESDFVAMNVPDAVRRTTTTTTTAMGGDKVWSDQMSYATPMSDFTFQSTKQDDNENISDTGRQTYDKNDDEQQRQHMDKLSIMMLSSSPETALGVIHSAELMDGTTNHTDYQAVDTKNLFPQSSETYNNKETILNHQEFVDSLSLMTLSPETAAGAVHYNEFLSSSEQLQRYQQRGEKKHEEERTMMMYPHETMAMTNNADSSLFIDSLSLMSSSETAVGAVHYGEYLSTSEREAYVAAKLLEQHEQREQQQPEEGVVSSEIPVVLPQIMGDIFIDERPIVVTTMESPFTVVQVNDAWVGLCGYTREEAINKNLGSMLQGDETDLNVIQDMVSTLHKEHYSEAIVTNYTKSGRKFRNHLKVGVLSSTTDSNNTSNSSNKMENEQFFVGVLEEILSSSSSSTSNDGASTKMQHL